MYFYVLQMFMVLTFYRQLSNKLVKECNGEDNYTAEPAISVEVYRCIITVFAFREVG